MHLSLLIMYRLSKTESGKFIACVISLLPKDLLFHNLYSLQLVLSASVAVLESLPVLHHGTDDIFWSFLFNELILVCFEYTA